MHGLWFFKPFFSIILINNENVIMLKLMYVPKRLKKLLTLHWYYMLKIMLRIMHGLNTFECSHSSNVFKLIKDYVSIWLLLSGFLNFEVFQNFYEFYWNLTNLNFYLFYWIKSYSNQLKQKQLKQKLKTFSS